MRSISMRMTAFLAFFLFTLVSLTSGPLSSLGQDEEQAAAPKESTAAPAEEATEDEDGDDEDGDDEDGDDEDGDDEDGDDEEAAVKSGPYAGVLAGVLAGAESDRLQLSEETRENLQTFVDQRKAAGAELADELKDEDPVKRAGEMLRFRYDSVRLAKETLLNVEQRDIVEQLRLQESGLLALVEPQVAGTVVLDDDQKKKVNELVLQHLQAFALEDEEERTAQQAGVQKQLAEVLSEDQQVTFNELLGTKEVAEAGDDDKPMPGDDDKPAKTTVASEAVVTPEGDLKLRFSFSFTPWQDVIEWFAEQADLSLQMDGPPPGTFNYTDKNYYTPGEAIDVMNGVLLTRGYTLVRRRQLLTLVNLEDEIPDVLVEYVPLAELDDRGEYELIKTLFQLVKMTPEEAEQDLQKLIGSTGKIYVFPAAKQILVQETAGRLRTIRSLIEAVEEPRSSVESTITEVELEYIPAEDVLAVARILMGLGEDDNRAEGISFGVDPLGTRIYLTGNEENIAIITDLVKRMDKDPLEGVEESGPVEQPQLQTHPIQAADPTSTYEVLQTMLAGLPDLRMSLDPTTNKIIAFARPSEQLKIKAVIAELEGEVPVFEVISLKTLDPTMALAMIGNMFGGDPEAPDPDGPKVTADITTMKLFVRATASEMDAIKQMIARLESENTTASGGNIRLIPWAGDSAIDAVERAARIWTGGNRIRVIAPEDRNSSRLDLRRTNEPPEEQPMPRPLPPRPEALPPRPGTSAPATSRPMTNQQQLSPHAAVQFVAEEAQQPAAGSGSEIIIEVTDDGILLVSEDLEALDQFETLLRQFMPVNASLEGESKITVFYLKYAKADVAASLVQQILSGGAGSSSGSIGSLMGDITGGLMGGGGGLMGMLLGTGGDAGAGDTMGATFEATSTVSIVADPRLNALVVQAVEEDVAMIEDLLGVIDKEGSITDVETKGKPRLIPVIYTSAESIANTVKEVYSDRLISSRSSGQSQQRGGNEDIMKMLQSMRGGGGGGGGRGGSSAAKSEPAKMSIGVDMESNSIVIAAPEPLFREVQELVHQLDTANIQSQDSLEVRTLKLTNPEVVQQALQSILGDRVQTTTSSGSSSSRPTGSSGGSGQPTADQIRQRMEFFNQLRGASSGGRPGGSGSTGGRPGGSGFPGGGRPGGSSGGRPGGSSGGGRPGGSSGGRP